MTARGDAALTPLVAIGPEEHRCSIELVYASDRNITGRPIYERSHCLLLEPAAACLQLAIVHAGQLGLGIKIFDAFRPAAAQQRLWDFLPDPTYIADVAIGSNHTRGVAVDLTLTEPDGAELDMGTAFDEMTPHSAHFHDGLPTEVQRHRMLLLGVMRSAGFVNIKSEWWHFELPQARQYPLLDDGHLGAPRLMNPS